METHDEFGNAYDGPEYMDFGPTPEEEAEIAKMEEAYYAEAYAEQEAAALLEWQTVDFPEWCDDEERPCTLAAWEDFEDYQEARAEDYWEARAEGRSY